MGSLNEFWRRLLVRIRGERFDRDLAEEMRLHLELRAAERRAEGVEQREAEAAARRQFGNPMQLAESSREAWGWTLLDTLKQDIRYGGRTLAANPGFTATAVLSLALGIGANTAIFSILNAVMLRSLPVEDPQRLVVLKLHGDNDVVTNPIWEQVRDHQQVFSGALAYSENRFNLNDGGQSQFAQGIWVSGDFFRVLGVPAIRGRVFSAEDDKRGLGRRAAVAVISYHFWKRRFASDPAIVGKTMRLDRNTFEVVGVTPPWFTGLNADKGFDLAIPLAAEPLFHADQSALDHRSWWWLRMVGRLAPGKTLQEANAQINAMSPAVMEATVPAHYPPDGQKRYSGYMLSVGPAATGFSQVGTRYRTALLVLMGIVGLVLLVACANIASLLLARATARQRELSVRMAMGASRARVIRQLMTESVILSLIGAVLGSLLAAWGGGLLVRLISTEETPLEINLSPDLHVLGFTMGAAILTALLFGLAPAWRATRLELNRVLKENSRSAVRGSSRFNLGKALVALQVTLSLVLVFGAVLFLGTLRNLLAVDLGFRPQGILMVRMEVQESSVPKLERLRLYQNALERLRQIPGATSGATADLRPVGHAGWDQFTFPEGVTNKTQDETDVFFNTVSPGYFHTMRTPLILGRDFNSHDDLNSEKVMIIGEFTAREFFGQANPIGKTIGVDNGKGRDPKDRYRVIGVVKDAKYLDVREDWLKTGFVALGQSAEQRPGVWFALRTDGPVGALAPAVLKIISGLNRNATLEFHDFNDQVIESLAQAQLVGLLSAVFGALALLLAMVGLYGVTSYAVTRRQGEIGIRIALGAARASVIRLMLRDVAVLLGVGLAIGLVVALASGRLVASLLYGVRFTDPVQLMGATSILAIAAILAAYLPARRAAELDPMVALREE